MSKSNGNNDRKIIEGMFSQYDTLNGFYRREELRKEMLKILGEFRMKIGQNFLSDDAIDEVMAEFGPRARKMADKIFGEHIGGKLNVDRVLVLGFLYDRMNEMVGRGNAKKESVQD